MPYDVNNDVTVKPNQHLDAVKKHRAVAEEPIRAEPIPGLPYLRHQRSRSGCRTAASLRQRGRSCGRPRRGVTERCQSIQLVSGLDPSHPLAGSSTEIPLPCHRSSTASSPPDLSRIRAAYLLKPTRLPADRRGVGREQHPYAHEALAPSSPRDVAPTTGGVDALHAYLSPIQNSGSPAPAHAGNHNRNRAFGPEQAAPNSFSEIHNDVLTSSRVTSRIRTADILHSTGPEPAPHPHSQKTRKARTPCLTPSSDFT